VLLPRIRLSGDLGPGRFLTKLHCPLLGLKLDIRQKIMILRILFFRFPLKKKLTDDKKIDLDESHAEDIPDTEENGEASEPIPETAEARPDRRYKRKPEKVKETGKMNLKDIWNERDLVIKLAAWLVDLSKRAIRFTMMDRLKVDLNIATPDPALTGVLFGITQPLTAFHNPPQREIRIGADFESASPRFALFFSFSVSPIVVIFEAAILLCKLPWKRLLQFYRRARKRRKSAESV